MTSSTYAAAVETRCSHALGVFPLVYCDQNVCWQTDLLFLTGWRSSSLLLRTLPKHNLYACVHAFLRPASLHMTASLPLSPSFSPFLPPPPPPVIRLLTGTTPTHSLTPGIDTEPGREQEICTGAPHPRSFPGCPCARRVCQNDHGFRFQSALVDWSFWMNLLNVRFSRFRAHPFASFRT